MNRPALDRLTRTLLFEGYALYPYRDDALKNRQPWSFGTLYPRAWCEAEGSDAWMMQTEVLVRGAAAVVEVCVRFRLEADEHEVGVAPEPIAALAALATGRERESRFAIAGGRVCGTIALSAEPVDGDAMRLRVRVTNDAPLDPALAAATDLRDRRRRVAATSMVATHTLIGVEDGALVSLLDPPAELAAAAAACRNEGTWPVLVGELGATDTVLSSPIILYDYPAVAPESAGDLYDATEIDEILTLRILTLSDDEKARVRAVDPRARAILERCERLAPEELARMHGAIRRLDRGGRAGRDPSSGLGPGDRVRLQPSPRDARTRNDAIDVVLAGRLATVVGVDQDLEGRVMIAVAIDDDPGRDLGVDGRIGHRFYFRPDELAAP